MTFAPKVRFGTKRPSITSTWIQSAPPSSSIAISSESFARSALRIDGAIRTLIPDSAKPAAGARRVPGQVRGEAGVGGLAGPVFFAGGGGERGGGGFSAPPPP